MFKYIQSRKLYINYISYQAWKGYRLDQTIKDLLCSRSYPF